MPRPSRRRRNSFTIDRIVSVPTGPGIHGASVEEVVEAVQAVPAPDDWPALAPMLVPIFQRLRPYFDAFPEPLRVLVPPGISISFAIDIGPALLHVSPDIAAKWPVSVDEMTERALENIADRAAQVPPDRVYRHPVGDVPSAWLQSGVGGASTFVLRPRELPRLFGPGPHLYIAPMRDLLIALPADVNREFALWLYAEIADQDPNCLAPIGFWSDGSRVTLEALEPEFATA